MSYLKFEKMFGRQTGAGVNTHDTTTKPYYIKKPHEDLDKKIVTIEISKSGDAKKFLLMITSTLDSYKYISSVCRSIRNEAIHFGEQDKGTDDYVEKYEIIESEEPTVTVLTINPINLIYHLSVVDLVTEKELKIISKFFSQKFQSQDEGQLQKKPKSSI